MSRRGRPGLVVRALAVLGMLLGLVVVPAVGAAACSCTSVSPAEVVGRTQVVLTGTLEAVDDPGGNVSPHAVAWRVGVDSVSRGRAASVTHLLALDGCGPGDIEPGRAYVFAAAVDGGNLRADLCGGALATGSVEAGALLATAGPGRAPDPAGTVLPGSAAPDLGSGGSASRLVTPALWGLGLVVVGLVGATRRRVARRERRAAAR